MKTPFSWTCPHCGRDTTITNSNLVTGNVVNHIQNADGYQRLSVRFIVCPNPDCRKYTLSCDLVRDDVVVRNSLLEYHLPTRARRAKKWNLIPPSTAKVFPDYVPSQIRKDYEEACLIVDLSPKSAASLARRCLQGMIRNFWSVTGENTLYDEIEAIKEKVEPLTWQAIDGIRKIGNIGAHMDKNADLIIEVDADEAKQLIGLIEILIKDWYINRAERQANLSNVKKIADKKERQRKPVRVKKKSDADSA